MIGQRGRSVPEANRKWGDDMRSRVIAVCALLALALGAQAAGASAAKLWLKNIANERAATGTGVIASMEFEGGCLDTSQEGALATNGKASDKFTLDPSTKYSACPGEKIAGSISGLTLKPAEGEAAMTVKSAIHVLFEPWCVYAVPKTITMPASPNTVSEVTVTAPLEKKASFGACAPIRALQLRVSVSEGEQKDSFHEPLYAEVV